MTTDTKNTKPAPALTAANEKLAEIRKERLEIITENTEASQRLSQKINDNR
jgi:regulator of PEP synthase PpsR (kinase-PPPase family)